MMPTDPLLPVGETQNRDLRVIRIVGNVTIAPDVIVGTSTTAWVQGVVPVTAQAFGIGATAVPNPSVDQPGWMYLNSGFSTLLSTATGGLGNAQKEVEIDNKSSRIIAKSGNILMHILRNIGTTDLQFNLDLRVLFRLP